MNANTKADSEATGTATMPPEVKALAIKIAKGKGMNTDERNLMMATYAGEERLRKAFADMIVELQKKTEKLTVELIQGEGRFGRYMKVTVPGSYKSLNMGKRKFERFMQAVKVIGYDTIIDAFNDDSKPASWELEVTEAK